MEQKGKKKNSVKLTDKKTKVIKEEIKEENNNSKIVVVSLILALLVALIAYVQFTKNSEEKEEKKDNIDVVEKQEEIEKEDTLEEESESDYVYSYVEVLEDNTDSEDEEKIVSTQVNTTVEEDVYYAITFEVNGGNILDKQILTQDETTYSVLPEREGWSFAGWYKDAEFSEEFIFGSKLESDMTLYAKWSKFVKYTVDGEEQDIINTVSEGEVVPLLTKEDLGIEDDSFEIAWNATNKDEYDNTVIFEVSEGTIFVPEDYSDSDTIILEMFKLSNFELAFYENENSQEAMHSQIVTELREIDFTDVNVIASEKYGEGVEFGWYYLTQEGVKFDFPTSKVAYSTITKLYLSEVYEVIYNEKVESEETEDTVYEEVGKQNVSKDSVITDVLVPEEKEDKTFDGWYIIDNNTNEETDNKLTNETVITGDLSVVGKWNDVVVEGTTEDNTATVIESTSETPVQEEQTEEEPEVEEEPVEPVEESNPDELSAEPTDESNE